MDNTEHIVEMAPGALTIEESLELAQECTGEREARENETAREDKELPRKFTVKKV